MFDVVDDNKDDKISRSEISEILRKAEENVDMPLTDEEWETLRKIQVRRRSTRAAPRRGGHSYV